MFASLGNTTLDPLASSSQAPRSSSLQAFEPSSFQAIKPSSFQAFKLSLRAFHLVGLIGIAKTKTSWKGGMGCKQTAYTHFASISQKKDCKSYSGTAHPSTLHVFFLCTALQTFHQLVATIYRPIYIHLQVLPQNLHHFMHLISAPSSMP